MIKVWLNLNKFWRYKWIILLLLCKLWGYKRRNIEWKIALYNHTEAGRGASRGICNSLADMEIKS